MMIVNPDRDYYEDIVEMAMAEYDYEKNFNTDLIEEGYEDQLRILVSRLIDNKYGKLAIDNQVLLGYILFEDPNEGFHGDVKGVFSPLGANSFRGEDRFKTLGKLLEVSLEDLTKDGIYSLAISQYAHDVEIQNYLYLNGFGARCGDSIMKLSDRSFKNKLINRDKIRELFGDDRYLVGNLSRSLSEHLCDSPVFIPNKNEDIRKSIGPDTRVFAYRGEDGIIAYMALDRQGETFITGLDKIYNITGAYVLEKIRGKNIGEDLLVYMTDLLEDEGIDYLGVDFETLNPSGFSFWNKYFSNYTYSGNRRIDERSFK